MILDRNNLLNGFRVLWEIRKMGWEVLSLTHWIKAGRIARGNRGWRTNQKSCFG